MRKRYGNGTGMGHASQSEVAAAGSDNDVLEKVRVATLSATHSLPITHHLASRGGSGFQPHIIGEVCILYARILWTLWR
jgi:hypothetical protein